MNEVAPIAARVNENAQSEQEHNHHPPRTSLHEGLPPHDLPSRSQTKPQNQRRHFRLLIALLLVTAAAASAMGIPQARNMLLAWTKSLLPPTPKTALTLPEPEASKPWDGTVKLDSEQINALGVNLEPIKPQVEPTRLFINGETAYDLNTQVQVRLRFTGVLDKVHVSLGERVKIGTPLVDLFSSDLAAAKSEFEKRQAQWEHDRGELERAEKLYQSTPRAISEREYYAMVNDEKLSRTEAKLAIDKLLLYGLSPEEIKQVTNEDGAQKGKMTLRAPAAGIVIRRDAVAGNRYDDSDVLLVIAPLEDLWVWGHVYPSNAGLVAVGQRWIVDCPLAEHSIETAIEAIATEIDDHTKTLRIRGKLPNPKGRIKADMLVTGYVEVPPGKGHLVIPRLAMVSVDGGDYAFVAKACEPATENTSTHVAPDSLGAKSHPTFVFDRRRIHVVQEYHDTVIVDGSLQPGECVVTRGSLILAQIYEDLASTTLASSDSTSAPLINSPDL